jgi:DNA-binding CsgD family transcriptional regulator
VLSAHIAILDDLGTIVFTNKSWQVFAQDNDMPPQKVSTGVNYLDICDRASGPFSAEARAFGAGIRSVLSGERIDYTLEYPCHSPDRKRWFIGRVTALKENGRCFAVVAHEDITRQKLSEIKLETMVKEKTRILTREIEHRKTIEPALEEKSRHLEQANLALKSMLDHRDAERRAIQENTFFNIKRFILPYLEDIEGQNPGENIMIPVNVIKTSLDQLLKPASKTLFAKYLNLTPMELKVADLVKQGMRTKEIGSFLKIAPGSVSTYRNNIRKKLNLRNSKTNLRVYLNSF